MRVHSLQLVNFRNYAEAEITFSPRKNIFLGNNGQGKTNVLEALYFLSHARSHRTAGDRELVRTGESFATVSAQLLNHLYEGRHLLESQIRLDGERLKTVFKVDGNVLRSRSEVLGHLPTVSFFLPDLLLLRGSPEDRRRWLDAAIVQYDKRHLSYLSEFHKVRQQKNRLLKAPPETISREHLYAWNIQLAVTAAKVMASRLAYLSMIDDLAALAYLELSEGREALTMAYKSATLECLERTSIQADSSGLPSETDNLPTPWLPDEAALEAALTQQLAEKMSEELRRGTCLVGPHRDDIGFYLNGLDADAYGSQGQQRSIVLALKLTELKCLTAKLQEPPVLLLDDVMAELDPDRQRLLVEHIHPDSQVFITTTHPADTWQSLLLPSTSEASSEDVAVFKVVKGSFLAHESSGIPEMVGGR